MLIQCDLHKLVRSVVDQRCTLLVIGVLKQLLAQIITKRICLGDVRTNASTKLVRRLRTGH